MGFQQQFQDLKLAIVFIGENETTKTVEVKTEIVDIDFIAQKIQEECYPPVNLSELTDINGVIKALKNAEEYAIAILTLEEWEAKLAEEEREASLC